MASSSSSADVLRSALPRLEHRPLVQQREAVVGDAVAAAERTRGAACRRARAGRRRRSPSRRGSRRAAPRSRAGAAMPASVIDVPDRLSRSSRVRRPIRDEIGIADVAHAAEIEGGGVAALDRLPKRLRLRLRDGSDVRRAARQVGDRRAQRVPVVEAALAGNEPSRVVERDRHVAVGLDSAACRDRAGRSGACRTRRAGARCSGSAAPSPRACRCDTRRAAPPPCRRTAPAWRRCGRGRVRGRASGPSSRRSPVRGRGRAARRAASARPERRAGGGGGGRERRDRRRRWRPASASRPSSAMRGCGGRTDAS